MTFSRLSSRPEYQALSSDSLPTTGIVKGATCWLTDTDAWKRFDGTTWDSIAMVGAGGGGGGGGGAVTVADNADVTQGAKADAAVAAGAAGSISAKLRSISRDIVANIVLAAGSAIIGKVGVDQTTPGTTDSVTVATGQGAGATIGAAADAVVAAGAVGTLSAKLRRVTQGLEDLKTSVVLAAGSAIIGKVGIDQTTPGTTDSVSVATAQGAGATIGATADAIVAAGAVGTLSAKLRRITQGLEDLKTGIVLAAGTAILGKVGIDQTTPGTTDSVSVATAQGAGATIGTAADAAITTNTTGSLSGKLRGLVGIFADVWDSTNHVLNVNPGALNSANDSVTASNTTGSVAHDGVDSGNPIKVGGQARSSQRTAVSTNADRVDAAFDMHGNMFVRTGQQGPSASVWTASHLPAANTQATATKASAGAGARNVCTSITVVLAAGASAPAAINLSVSLIDGASGGGTYLWRATISLPATAGAMTGVTLPVWLPGTAATAMTLEFSVAGGANTVESVTMSGITVTE